MARLQMTRMAQAAPTRKPVTTCESECCRSIMRAVPTAPASHQHEGRATTGG